MKRRLIILCVALTLLFSGAFAEQAGNLNNGGFVFTQEDCVYLASSDGLWMISSGKSPEKIEDGPVSMLQADLRRIWSKMARKPQNI